MLERRSVLASLAALPVAMLPAFVPGAPAAAPPRAFEPTAFIADLKAAGYGVVAYHEVPRGGEVAGPSGYFIRPPTERGFGAAYSAVMAKWWDAIEACPDHAERVAVHVLGPIGRAA